MTKKLIYKKNDNWRAYWNAPLPAGAEALGVIKREGELAGGVLLKLASGVYVQGNARGLRSLDQAEVQRLLDISAAAAAIGTLGGSVKSEAKTAAARENARKPRPRGADAVKSGLDENGNYVVTRESRNVGFGWSIGTPVNVPDYTGNIRKVLHDIREDLNFQTTTLERKTAWFVKVDGVWRKIKDGQRLSELIVMMPGGYGYKPEYAVDSVTVELA